MSYRFTLYFDEMNALPKSQILRFTEKAVHLTRRAVSRYPSKYSKHRYTLPQHVVLLCLKVRKTTTYRGLLDELIEMPHIRRVLGLSESHTLSGPKFITNCSVAFFVTRVFCCW